MCIKKCKYLCTEATLHYRLYIYQQQCINRVSRTKILSSNSILFLCIYFVLFVYSNPSDAHKQTALNSYRNLYLQLLGDSFVLQDNLLLRSGLILLTMFFQEVIYALLPLAGSIWLLHVLE